MPRDLPFEVPDLDLPPPRAKAIAPVVPPSSVYDESTLERVPFLDASSVDREAPTTPPEREPLPRVTHVDQAIFEAAAREEVEELLRPSPVPLRSSSPPAYPVAVSGTTRCPACTSPIAFHARFCPHCAAPVVPLMPFARPAAPPIPSEPVTLGSRIMDTLAAIPYAIWKRMAFYTFFVAVIGNACLCRGFGVGTNVICATVIAISFLGIGACVRSQRSP